MDDNKSAPIISQSIQPEVLPPESNQTRIPTAADLPSHHEDLSWKDGAEFIAEGASGVPFAGPAIKRFIEFSTGVGQYSQENRLETLQWKWLLDQIPVLQEKIDILLNRLPDEEKPEPADFAAVVKAVLQASEKTADSKKRRLLKNALINAFDLEQYSNGLTLRLIAILEDLEYGDIELLGRILEADQKIASHTQSDIDRALGRSTYKDQQRPILDKQQILKARVIFGENFKLLPTSIVFHHLDILEKYGLIIIEDYSEKSSIRGTSARADTWQRLINNVNSSYLRSGYIRMPQLTSLGEQLLKLVLKDSDSNE